MPRIQFSDVTPPEKRSIRNIPIPSGGKRKPPVVIKPENVPAPEPEVYKEETAAAPDYSKVSKPSGDENISSRISEITSKGPSNTYEYYYPQNQSPKKEKPGKPRKKFVFGFIAFAAVVIFVVSMMTVFASATVSITPKNQDIGVHMNITASNEANESESGVRYEVIKLSKSKTISVPASGEEAAELKASGRIVIFNDYSSDPQRLITRTRFESPEGLVYRIAESIVVPGKTTKNGAETPGSIEVEVFADEAGEKYNIGKTDFTIPGFKNDAGRYKKFYAKSSTDMIGGFIGKMKTVSSEEKETAMKAAEIEAKADLEKELVSKTPDGLVLVPGSVYFESRELTPEEEMTSVKIGKEVTAYALMLNSSDLSEKIVSEYLSNLANWNGIPAKVYNFSSLKTLDLPEKPQNQKEIKLQIDGNAKVWAEINADSISQKLPGIPKKEVVKLMDELPGISSITAAIRPLWKRSFPEDPAKIYVNIANEE